MTFNIDTLEQIVYQPDSILANWESFWTGQRAQVLTKKWADQINYKIDFDKIRKQITDWSSKSISERENSKFMQNAKIFLDNKDVIIKKSLEHICTYLPDDANLDLTVQFTAFIPSRCFAFEDIVFNMNAAYWNDDVQNMINSVVHEIFHAGYSYYREFQTDDKEVKNFDILDNLISEGICTFIAYRALPFFPAPDEKDYYMLDNKSQVSRLFDDLNEILTTKGNISDEEHDKLRLEKGIKGRAFYVPGAYVCQKIEEWYDKEKLVEMLLIGPYSLIKLYNSMIDEERLKIDL